MEGVVQPHLAGMHEPGDRVAQLGLAVIDAVSADERAVGFIQRRKAAFHHLHEDRHLQLVHGKAHEADRGAGRAAHGVHVGKRIGRGDPSERERVVHDRRKEVHRVDQRVLVVQAQDAGAPPRGGSRR